LPTLVQATVFVTLIAVAVLRAWLGAGIVARMKARAIQFGMGVALLVAARS
jgi:uncharacterized membrane protein YfcA